MLRSLSLVFFMLIGAFALGTVQPAHAATMTEQQKIDALISALETSDVTFIRNGTAMSNKDAAQHLRDKVKEMKPATADDFINKVANGSRESGKPYTIKAKDGKEEASAQWFKDQLAKITK